MQANNGRVDRLESLANIERQAESERMEAKRAAFGRVYSALRLALPSDGIVERHSKSHIDKLADIYDRLVINKLTDDDRFIMASAPADALHDAGRTIEQMIATAVELDRSY